MLLEALDRCRQVLVLYRKRSGDEFFGYAGILSAGAFLIQRLEGSRFGTLKLWVLNGANGGEVRGRREWIGRKRRRECWLEDFAQLPRESAGQAGALVALMFGWTLES